MATFSLSPVYPIPNKEVKIKISPSVTGTNYYRVWATVAPTNSDIDKKIRDSSDPRNRVEIFAETGGDDFPLIIKFDKGGKYTFVVQEYIKGSGYGGGYEGDPAGSNNEEKNGQEYTLYVYVGQRLTQAIGPSEHRATLNVWIWEDTVRATYKSIHGEDTPSITAQNYTDRIKSAIESQSVKDALLSIVDQTSTAVLGNIQTMVTQFYSKWSSHLASSSFHIAADPANVLDASLQTAYSPLNLREFVNSAITNMNHHVNNDNSFDITATPPAGPGKGPYHALADRPHAPLYRSVSTLDEAYGGLSDLCRCYELHRVSVGSVHVTADNTNSLPALPLLMNIHREYLNIIAASSPTPPLAQSTGAQILISGAGFKE